MIKVRSGSVRSGSVRFAQIIKKKLPNGGFFQMEFDAPQTHMSAPQMEIDAPQTRITAPEMDFDFIPSSKTALNEDGSKNFVLLVN